MPDFPVSFNTESSNADENQKAKYMKLKDSKARSTSLSTLENKGLKESPSFERQNYEAQRSFQKLCLRLQLVGTTEVIRLDSEDTPHIFEQDFAPSSICGQKAIQRSGFLRRLIRRANQIWQESMLRLGKFLVRSYSLSNK